MIFLIILNLFLVSTLSNAIKTHGKLTVPLITSINELKALSETAGTMNLLDSSDPSAIELVVAFLRRTIKRSDSAKADLNVKLDDFYRVFRSVEDNEIKTCKDKNVAYEGIAVDDLIAKAKASKLIIPQSTRTYDRLKELKRLRFVSAKNFRYKSTGIFFEDENLLELVLLKSEEAEQSNGTDDEDRIEAGGNAQAQTDSIPKKRRGRPPKEQYSGIADTDNESVDDLNIDDENVDDETVIPDEQPEDSPELYGEPESSPWESLQQPSETSPEEATAIDQLISSVA